MYFNNVINSSETLVYVKLHILIAVSSWKLSRDSSLSDPSNAAINEAMSKVKVLDQRYYERNIHTEEACFYYPENNGGPVILEGQCDDSDQIAVVDDFDASAVR